MKKFTISLMSLLLVANLAFAGGLVTNSNQSTAWARMLVRDASTSIDAVYFNPAGLTKLDDGLYISFSNQSIFQDHTLTNSFPYLNDKTFKGTIRVPVFPSIYAAYKVNRWAFSFGFNIISGGGTADFSKGIPMAEVPISSLVGAFSSLGVTGYSVDMAVKGTTISYGLQVGVSYAISDHVSVYAGVRYVITKNSYTGYIKDIKLKTAGGDVRADDFMNGEGDKFMLGASDINTLDSLGAGPYTIDQLVSAKILPAAEAAELKAALGVLGATPDQISQLTIAEINTNFGPGFVTFAKQMYGGAKLMGDQDIDVNQSGNGFTPIIGVNLSFMDDNLNFGIKYEFKTKITLTNSTPVGKGFVIGMKPDGTSIEMFPDGGKVNADMPAMLSVGAKINVSKVVSLQAGFHTYWDSKTGWENVKQNINKNFQEYALGAEFHVSKYFLLSCGYLYAKTGVNPSYQSDFSYSLTSNTVGAGGAWKINDALTLQFGGFVANYKSQTVPGSADVGGTAVSYNTKYKESTWALSVGLDVAIGKNKKKK